MTSVGKTKKKRSGFLSPIKALEDDVRRNDENQIRDPASRKIVIPSLRRNVIPAGC
jgi:hypothetical protein